MRIWKRRFRGPDPDSRLDQELQDHVDRLTADYVRSGLSPREARRRAVLEFGGVESVKEACRDVRRLRFLADLGQDLRYGIRVLRRSPTFTLVALLSLALGIGANTTLFALIDALLLRSLPVLEPERLVRHEGGSWTNPIWEEIREREGEILQGAAAYSDTRFDLARGGEAQPVEGLFVSGSFFDVLGVPAMLGRILGPVDDRGGGGESGPGAVISYAFWQRSYGGDGNAVGRALTLNGVPFTVVGVTPPSFFGPTVGRSYDVAVPIGTVDRLQPNGPSPLSNRSMWWLEIIGRMRAGQTPETATRALRRVQPAIRAATLPEGRPAEALEAYLRGGLTLVGAANGASPLRGQYQRPLLALSATATLVLLIACANLAGLLLARASARRRELGARLALGASRLRLARQLLTESVLLAAPGGALGLALAGWSAPLLVAQIANEGGPAAGTPVFLDLALRWTVPAFALAAALASALLFGVVPAFRAAWIAPHDALRQHNGAPARGRGAGAGGPLLVLQVAFSMVLVFSAGLFLQTFSRLAGRDLGLDRDGILLVEIDAQRSAQPPERRGEVLDGIEDAVRAVPGVHRAGLSLMSPLSGAGWNRRFEPPDSGALSEEERLAWMNAVRPGWFGTFGVRLLAGRDFDDSDSTGTGRVAIVNEAFARRFFGGRSPLGRILEQATASEGQAAPVEIVGLVEDSAYRSPRDAMEPIVYVAHAQLPDWWGVQGGAPPFATLGVRALAGSPALLARDLARAIGRVDPGLSVSFRLLSDQLDAAMRQERLTAWLSSFFGGVALLLAGIGLYGVTAHAVNGRRVELGVRAALGARARALVGLVLARALGLVGLGIALGALGSLWASQAAASLLYGLTPGHLPTLARAAAILAVVALAAAGVPALRAIRIDPARVLREG